MARNKTAWTILEAIVAGERDPKALAACTHGNIKGGSAVIEQALEGMLLGDHHPVLRFGKSLLSKERPGISRPLILNRIHHRLMPHSAPEPIDPSRS
jgi:hypothetical protein